MVTQKDKIVINMEYANDVSKLVSNRSFIESFKHYLLEVLEPRDLTINKDKTKTFD